MAKPPRTSRKRQVKKTSVGRQPQQNAPVEKRLEKSDCDQLAEPLPSSISERVGKYYLTVYKFFSSFWRSFKLELILALIGVVLGYGQYIQNITAIRISVTQIWREGYSSEVRDLVTKYIVFHKRWESQCKLNNNCENLTKTVKTLVDPGEIYYGQIENDFYIRQLICGDLKTSETKSNQEDTKKIKFGLRTKVVPPELKQACDLREEDEPTREEIIKNVLKYRNAIIECLNTAEAVKAVMDAKPYLKRDIVYKDTLAGRYRDIIEEHKRDLGHFINEYRLLKNNRETSAWFVLTNDESEENERKLIRDIIKMLMCTVMIVFLLWLLARWFEKNKSVEIH